MDLIGGMEPRQEARNLIQQIDEVLKHRDDTGLLVGDDPTFIASIIFKMDSPGYQPSPKEIRWLRDIRDRVTQA